MTPEEQQQWERSKSHLDQMVSDLVKAISDVGEAKIAADEHRLDRDNYTYASEHRRVEAGAQRTLTRAVDAYVRLRRGPQPDPEAKIT